MTTRSAFVLGAIIATAVTVSLFRRPKYPSFSAWWEAEGIVVWIIAGMFGCGIYLV